MEINKNNLDFNLGEQILKNLPLKERKIGMDLIDISENSDTQTVFDHSKLVRFKTTLKSNKSSKIQHFKRLHKPIKNVFSTSKSNSEIKYELTENNFNTIISNENIKMPGYKISYREYFCTMPKCDICNVSGISIEEFRKLNKEMQTDIAVLEYLLFQCKNCKVRVHRNCACEANIPFINVRDKVILSGGWTCDRCTEITKGQVVNVQCQICFKNEVDMTKPHFLIKLTKNFWVHGWCFIWFKPNNIDFNKSFEYVYC